MSMPPAGSERVILVDQHDQPIGDAEKIAAHQDGGQLHRAFSVVVFDEDGRMLLQRRAACKYHFGGLWSNTCCGHPRPGEATIAAGERRLNEEFGFATSLTPTLSFIYRAAHLESGLTEHEYLHVLIGVSDAMPAPDPAEISEYRWIAPSALRAEMQAFPDHFTPWFRTIEEKLEMPGRTHE